MTLTPEDELDILRDEVAKAVRRLWSLENAPYEGRVGDQAEWERSVHFARQNLRELRRELDGAIADLIAEAEGFVS